MERGDSVTFCVEELAFVKAQSQEIITFYYKYISPVPYIVLGDFPVLILIFTLIHKVGFKNIFLVLQDASKKL